MKDKKFQFRESRIIPKRKFHQRMFRPLALWLAQKKPEDILFSGLVFACAWFVLRLMVVHFYGVIFMLPWIIMAVAIVLALLTQALQGGNDDE